MTPAVASVGVVVTRDLVLEHAQALPAAPQVLGSLCELLEDVNTDLDQIAEQIRVDSALAARVLRISSSPVFGGGAAAKSIDEAVLRVGFAEIARLVGIATVAGLADRALQAYGLAAERLREALLMHAVASEALAQCAGVEPRSVYTVGLMRGVGMMVLDRIARGRPGFEPFDATQFETYAAWERVRFGVTSAEVTTMILDEWRFPADLVAAVEQHTGESDDQMANVLNLAGAIAQSHGLALAGEEKLWNLSGSRLAAAGLTEEAYEAASERAAKAFAHQRPALY